MKKVLLTALILVVFAVNKKINAQQGFPVSVRTTALFNFFQNRDDLDNCSIQQKAIANVTLGIGAGYSFTPALGVAMNGLYSRHAQCFKFNNNKTNPIEDSLKNPVHFTFSNNLYKPVFYGERICFPLKVPTDSIVTDINCHRLKSKLDARCVREQRP
jgi:hypothetical protein